MPSAAGAADETLDPRCEPDAYLTRAIEGVGGVIKERDEDFLVEEQPAVQPDGAPDHLHLFIEKRGLSTNQLVSELARRFGVRRENIGFAGLKDKHAVTRQVISVATGGRSFEEFPTIDDERLRVLWADTHSSRLSRGQSVGNRFSVRIRDVSIASAPAALRALQRLEHIGAPNRFGAQRFGVRRNNHLVGRALLAGDDDGAVKALLSPPIPPEKDPLGAEARGAVDELRYADAANLITDRFRMERRVCERLATNAATNDALHEIPENIRNLWISAFQSAVFNHLLDEHLEEAGDDDALLAALAEGTGPLWGVRLRQPDRDAGDRELAALQRVGVTLESLREATKRWRVRVTGDRRPYLMQVRDVDLEAGADEHGQYIRCAFELPPGGFATAVLHEIMKPVRVAEREDEESEEA